MPIRALGRGLVLVSVWACGGCSAPSDPPHTRPAEAEPAGEGADSPVLEALAKLEPAKRSTNRAARDLVLPLEVYAPAELAAELAAWQEREPEPSWGYPRLELPLDLYDPDALERTVSRLRGDHGRQRLVFPLNAGLEPGAISEAISHLHEREIPGSTEGRLELPLEIYTDPLRTAGALAKLRPRESPGLVGDLVFPLDPTTDPERIVRVLEGAPETLLGDGDGRLVFPLEPYLDPFALEKALEELRPADTTKPVGDLVFPLDSYDPPALERVLEPLETGPGETDPDAGRLVFPLDSYGSDAMARALKELDELGGPGGRIEVPLEPGLDPGRVGRALERLLEDPPPGKVGDLVFPLESDPAALGRLLGGVQEGGGGGLARLETPLELYDPAALAGALAEVEAAQEDCGPARLVFPIGDQTLPPRGPGRLELPLDAYLEPAALEEAAAGLEDGRGAGVGGALVLPEPPVRLETPLSIYDANGELELSPYDRHGLPLFQIERARKPRRPGPLERAPARPLPANLERLVFPLPQRRGVEPSAIAQTWRDAVESSQLGSLDGAAFLNRLPPPGEPPPPRLWDADPSQWTAWQIGYLHQHAVEGDPSRPCPTWDDVAALPDLGRLALRLHGLGGLSPTAQVLCNQIGEVQESLSPQHPNMLMTSVAFNDIRGEPTPVITDPEGNVIVELERRPTPSGGTEWVPIDPHTGKELAEKDRYKDAERLFPNADWEGMAAHLNAFEWDLLITLLEGCRGYRGRGGPGFIYELLARGLKRRLAQGDEPLRPGNVPAGTEYALDVVVAGLLGREALQRIVQRNQLILGGMLISGAIGDNFDAAQRRLAALGLRRTGSGVRSGVRTQPTRPPLRPPPIHPVTAEQMKKHGLTKDTWVYRAMKPEHVRGGKIAGTPKPSAKVMDVYRPLDHPANAELARLGAAPRRYAPQINADALPRRGVNVYVGNQSGVPAPVRVYQSTNPGTVIYRFRLGDARAFRIYPDARGLKTKNATPLFITFEGQIPVQRVR